MIINTGQRTDIPGFYADCSGCMKISDYEKAIMHSTDYMIPLLLF